MVKQQREAESIMGSRKSISGYTNGDTDSNKQANNETLRFDEGYEVDPLQGYLQDMTLAGELAELNLKIREIQRHVDAACHPRWGPLLRSGYQLSRFGKQVSDYACLYTSRASNLGLVSPLRPFRPKHGSMPHDDLLLDYNAGIASE